MIRLLVVDDHTVVRESLIASLAASGDCVIVGAAGDGIEAIDLALQLRPDIAIVDLSLPRLSGFEVVRRLAQQQPNTKVLVLTMHEEEEYVVQAVRAGASGYVSKRAATTEVLAAIRTLAGGGVHFGNYAASVMADQLHHRRDGADPYGNLSPREREVLHLVADGLTIKEISTRLGISVKTAENHRSRVLAKLGVRNSAELVRYAMRRHLVD
jgi:two-component system, NarL family, response regulator NreC